MIKFHVLTLLILFLCTAGALAQCSMSKKVSCVAAMTGCGGTCICDLPVCECCPVCLACVTATVADCCECLFPTWSGCTDEKLMSKVNHLSKSLTNQTASDPCVCYVGGGKYSCGAVFAGAACCNSKWCPCNPNMSPCQCATALC